MKAIIEHPCAHNSCDARKAKRLSFQLQFAEEKEKQLSGARRLFVNRCGVFSFHYKLQSKHVIINGEKNIEKGHKVIKPQIINHFNHTNCQNEPLPEKRTQPFL